MNISADFFICIFKLDFTETIIAQNYKRTINILINFKLIKVVFSDKFDLIQIKLIFRNKYDSPFQSKQQNDIGSILIIFVSLIEERL